MMTAMLMRSSPEMLLVRDPDDGAVVAEIACTSDADIERALERGVRACRSAAPPAHERARTLREVADRVEQTAEEHAVLITREGIKTIREARAEVRRTCETLRLSAEEAKRIGGEVIGFDQVAKGEGRRGWWEYRPGGLVVAITPFNDPLNLVAHKIGPAYALGAPIIVKPHPQTPISAQRLVEHFHAAGARSELVQVVLGDARAGAMLISDQRPRIISFTGGHAAARQIVRAAGLKRLILELGGVGLVGVAADADLDAAVAAITSGAFWAAGQNCVRAQRIVVDAAVAESLAEGLNAAAAAIRLGWKRDEMTDMGPLVSVAAADGLRDRLREMRAAGAQIIAGGANCDGEGGNRLPPTWVFGLPTDNSLLRDELFGPVSTVELVHGTEQLMTAFADANPAINAALFTRSLASSFEAYGRMNAAALLINDSTDFRIDAMPFGGIGASGIGREGVRDTVAALAEKRLMIVRP